MDVECKKVESARCTGRDVVFWMAI